MTERQQIIMLYKALINLSIQANDACEVISDDMPIKLDLYDAITQAKNAIDTMKRYPLKGE